MRVVCWHARCLGADRNGTHAQASNGFLKAGRAGSGTALPRSLRPSSRRVRSTWTAWPCTCTSRARRWLCAISTRAEACTATTRPNTSTSAAPRTAAHCTQSLWLRRCTSRVRRSDFNYQGARKPEAYDRYRNKPVYQIAPGDAIYTTCWFNNQPPPLGRKVTPAPTASTLPPHPPPTPATRTGIGAPKPPPLPLSCASLSRPRIRWATRARIDGASGPTMRCVPSLRASSRGTPPR